ncbi:phosphatidylinositol-4-phosphate 5-kinase [Trypanosoma theileri]|uniref:Phosphatidylinositol-4-phosphate 5-kinase n=1 Tax=Trypanosoma theileri TaxID=67003 RepID=A0A1X0P9B0_9TRYP|nr:phosphatidylinositol-4-phosphate 5-kinase [Trypanosoma theileri]ORC93179.1 phosphatidylinositol-4-phosphate 5-kinase [Trypanosoma theileri]
MGVCQTIGGAATSGRGLTGRQVAGALAAAAAAQLKSHHDRMKAEEDGEATGIARRTISSVNQSLEQMDKGKYSETRVLRFKVPNSGGIMEEVVVYEYAPDVFRFLRQLAGVDEEVFADEWTLPEERLGLEMGEGRSMALFLKSKSMYLMCKTIAKVEVDILLGFLRQYTEHLARNDDTLLMRFSMLLRVEVGSEVGYILCFDDVFGPCRTLNEKWDLKGRKPKPGKYLLFPKLIRHPYEPNPYIIDTPRETLELPEFLDALGGGVVLVEAEDKDKLQTRKDKDLTRLFWLEKQTREKLLHVLIRDYDFLASAGLMDYSLLIGVAYNETKVSRSGKHIRSMRMTYPMGSESDADRMEVRPNSSLRRASKSLVFAEGISSLYDQEIYYIGIIDMLTTYTWKKKTANFCKSFLWKSDTLSTIPPKAYRDRIVRYTKIIFPEVNLDDNTSNT